MEFRQPTWGHILKEKIFPLLEAINCSLLFARDGTHEPFHGGMLMDLILYRPCTVSHKFNQQGQFMSAMVLSCPENTILVSPLDLLLLQYLCPSSTMEPEPL